MHSSITRGRRLAAPCLAAFLAAFLAAEPSWAAIEGDYTQETAGPPETTWYVPANPATLKADRDYIAGMRPHHAGALTMARAYLDDPQSSSLVLRNLAHAIIRNQAFEIALLDQADAKLREPPVEINLGFTTLKLQAAASEGLAQRLHFLRTPSPGAFERLWDQAPVTARDVEFIKGMTMHHEAAVEMARAYHADPAGRNGFLGLMNIDIVRDQSQEIGVMQSVLKGYRGDPDRIVVDPASVPGMEGMHHGGPASPTGHGAGGAEHGAHRH